MTSEIAKPSTLRLKQWEVCKGRILAKVQALAEFNGKTIKEMIPDIRIIKENRLWEHGGYDSFKQFCMKVLGVTKQHIYKILKDDEETRKVLEINDGESSYLTFDGQTVSPQLPADSPPAPSQPKQINDPPKPASKGRKPKPESEPIEASFTEPAPSQFPATVTANEAMEQARHKIIPDAVINGEITCEQHARDILERMGIEGAQDFSASSLVEIANLISKFGRSCPHCGGAL